MWSAIVGSVLVVAGALYAFSGVRAQTCTDYEITVLGGDASFTNEFLYRTSPGGCLST